MLAKIILVAQFVLMIVMLVFFLGVTIYAAYCYERDNCCEKQHNNKSTDILRF